MAKTNGSSKAAPQAVKASPPIEERGVKAEDLTREDRRAEIAQTGQVTDNTGKTHEVTVPEKEILTEEYTKPSPEVMERLMMQDKLMKIHMDLQKVNAEYNQLLKDRKALSENYRRMVTRKKQIRGVQRELSEQRRMVKDSLKKLLVMEGVS